MRYGFLSRYSIAAQQSSCLKPDIVAALVLHLFQFDVRFFSFLFDQTGRLWEWLLYRKYCDLRCLSVGEEVPLFE